MSWSSLWSLEAPASSSWAFRARVSSWGRRGQGHSGGLQAAPDRPRVSCWASTGRSKPLAQPPLDTRRLGRYPTILMSLLGLTVFGFGTAFVNTFRQYLFFRFGVSQALVCYAISSVCLGEAQLPGRGMGRGFPLGAHRGRGLPPPPPPRTAGAGPAWGVARA